MIIRFIMCFFTSISLNITFIPPENLKQITCENKLLDIFYNFQSSLTGTLMSTTFIFVILCFLEVYFAKKQIKRNSLLFIICFFLAILWAMGESFRCVDSLLLLYANSGQIVKSFIYIIGMTWFLTELALLLSLFLDSKLDWGFSSKNLKKIYSNHSFSISFAGIVICWLPNLLLSYPATTCVDVWTQLLQFFGQEQFTSHHPPIHTNNLSES